MIAKIARSLVLFLLLLSFPALAGEIRVTNNSVDMLTCDYLSASNEWLAWACYKGPDGTVETKGWDLFIYNTATGTTEHLVRDASQMVPNLDGNLLVWQDWGIPQWSIGVRNLSTGEERHIPLGPGRYYDEPAAVNGNRIVYTDVRGDIGSYSDVFVYDLTTNQETQLSSGGYNQWPSIAGNWVVWKNEGFNNTIYLRNIATGEQRDLQAGWVWDPPKIEGTTVVWSERVDLVPSGQIQRKIQLYDLASGNQRTVVTVGLDYNNLQLKNGRLAYTDFRGDNQDIFIYDLQTDTESQLTKGPEWNTNPALAPDRIAWFGRVVRDVYTATLSRADTDFDGVTDNADRCPSEDARGFDSDHDGCVDNAAGLGQMVSTLVGEGVVDPGIEAPLLAKVDAAQHSTDKDNICAAINQLTALKNQVAGQTGKKISAEAAATLIAYIENVISWMLQSLPPGSC